MTRRRKCWCVEVEGFASTIDTINMFKIPQLAPETSPNLACAARRVGESPTGFLFVRSDNQYYNIALSSICYIEASSNYCRVVTTEGFYMVLARLKDFAEALPSPIFCQIHRAFLVIVAHVARFDRKHVFIGHERLSIGDHYYAVLLAAAPIFNPVGRALKP
jgi:DNA-binding LytR/AlgR family response regulator